MKTARTWVRLVVTCVGALCFATCAPSMMGDALVDLGTAMGDGAAAQDAGHGSGSATVPADQNPAQVVGGTVVATTTATEVEAGPFYLTDLQVQAYVDRFRLQEVTISISTDATCGDFTEVYAGQVYAQPFPGATNPVITESMHGARIFVPAGQSLCISSQNDSTAHWSGFRPY